MMRGLGPTPPSPQNQIGIYQSPRQLFGLRATHRRNLMQWQTPTATDLRFGFEITLYVSNR